MIPTATKKGTSFKGAAAYFLHDKNANTNERVEFTQTQNLPTNDPEKAWKMMAYTAMHQSEIKRSAGGVAKGRKLTQPVYTYSLSWHPTQKPEKEHMIEAGLKTLKILGLCDHESIMVAHNDEPHPHMHLIVNRVHPETGIAAKLSNDHLKLSKWAEKYERDHGKILCEQRVKNNERRRNGDFVKHREALNKAEFYRWQREKVNQACNQRQKDAKNLSSIHKKQRDKLFNAKENIVDHRRKELKELSRPFWASMFRQQKQERLELQEAKSSAFGRLSYYIKNRNQERQHGTLDIKKGLVSGACNAVINFKGLENDLNKKQEQKRKAFAQDITQQSRIALKQINNEYIRDLENLKSRQVKEENLMKSRHSEESKKRASDIASGRTKDEFNRIKRAQALRDEYNKKSAGKPTGVKEEFNKKQQKPPDIQKDFRTARYMKQQQERNKTDDLKKPREVKKEDRTFRYVNDNRRVDKGENPEKETDMKKDFRKSRYLPDHQEKDKDRGRFTNRGTSKDTGMDREL